MNRPPPQTPGMAQSFDEVILPHLAAAHRLARWLTGNEYDAEDAVQEASLRALRYFRTFSGRNSRAWFFRIVRNVCWTRHRHQITRPIDLFDEEQHSNARSAPDPETLLLHADDVSLINRTLRNLPNRFRELLVLRELEGLSYQELADVLEVPIGTVMSGLSRARRALRGTLELQARGPDNPRRTGSRDHESVTDRPPTATAHTLDGGFGSVLATADPKDSFQEVDL